ncbi:hypothetical protein F5148DRAFT_1352786 [Russula earlei]|uniref:Uncharacterized protein n=1 Tax=Russula earlei TaxID=71964 RepID=A0ACC0UC20_9AGAM|nr:hypothetical protein F5148DRAFT_1352786 [Russula earlei]
MCLMPGIVGVEGFDDLGMEETQGRLLLLEVAACSSSSDSSWGCSICSLLMSFTWHGGEMVVWSGSRGVGGKHEFIGISIGGTGGIEMAIVTGEVGGMAGAKAAEVAAGNTVDRAEAPKDKAEMAAAAGDAGDAAELENRGWMRLRWRQQMGRWWVDLTCDGQGSRAIIQSSVLLWHLGNILKLLESLLECLGERDRTQQLHHLGKGHQSALMQPRVRIRTLKMSICLVASSKQHFLFNLVAAPNSSIKLQDLVLTILSLALALEALDLKFLLGNTYVDYVM